MCHKVSRTHSGSGRIWTFPFSFKSSHHRMQFKGIHVSQRQSLATAGSLDEGVSHVTISHRLSSEE
jgi:hypothetical protein